MAFDKLIVYDSRPDSTGIPLIFPASGSLVKTASEVHPDLLAYLGQLGDPDEDTARAVITALSAYDTFGPNNNGDAFFREDLLKKWDYSDDAGQEPGSLVLPMFETFEHFARPYKHHLNRPDSPAYGEVLRAIFNPKMDRVELVVAFSREKAPDIVRKIENYEPLSTSMGFRAKYDVCEVCGNKAKSRAEYCEHAKFMMLRVMPDGKVVCVRNPEGKFFDISVVGTPADLTSRAVAVTRLPIRDGHETMEMRKAASQKVSAETDVYLSADLAEANGYGTGDLIVKQADKRAEDKDADIQKRVTFTSDVELSPEDEEIVREGAEALRAREPMLSRGTMDHLADTYPLEVVASTLSLCGISLKPEEAQYIGLRSLGMPKTASRLLSAGVVVVDVPAEKGLQISDEHFDVKLAESLSADAHLLSSRSLYRGWLPERQKIAAMGVNPYLSSRSLTSPQVAYSFADLEDQPQTGYDRRGTLRYLAGLLMGAEWAIRRRKIKRLVKQHPELFARLVGGPALQAMGIPAMDMMDARRPAVRAAEAEEEPLPMRMLMTAPIAHYMRGVSHGPVYKTAGLLEHALTTDRAMVRLASETLRGIPWSRMQKTASEIKVSSDLIEIYGLDIIDAESILRTKR